MAGYGATGEQHIVLGKRFFYSASFSVEFFCGGAE